MTDEELRAIQALQIKGKRPAQMMMHHSLMDTALTEQTVAAAAAFVAQELAAGRLAVDPAPLPPAQPQPVASPSRAPRPPRSWLMERRAVGQ